MRRIALAFVAACALAGCGARAELESAFGHALRDVRVLENRPYGETFVVGRIKEEVPLGLALPWEGRWVPFESPACSDD